MGRKINKNQHVYKKNDSEDLYLLKDSSSLSFTYDTCKSDHLLVKNNNFLNQLSAKTILPNSQKIILICIIIIKLILLKYFDFFNITLQFFHFVLIIKYGVIALKITNRI